MKSTDNKGVYMATKEAPQPQPKPEDMKNALTPEQSGEDPVTAALNNPDFVRFNDRFERDLDLTKDGDKETLRLRHERFQKIDGVIKDVQDILAEGFSRDMTTEHMSIGIDAGDIELAREYIEGLALDEDSSGKAKSFDDMLGDISDCRHLEQQCAELSKQVDDKQTQLEKRIQTADKLKDLGGFRLGYSRSEKAAMKDAKALGLDREDGGKNDEIIEQTTKELEGLDSEYTKAMDSYVQKQNDLVAAWEHGTGARKLAEAKVADIVSADKGSRTLDQIAAIRKHRAALKERRDAREKEKKSVRINYFDSDQIKEGDFMAEMDQEAEEFVRSEMQTAIERAPLKNTLSHLREELKPLLTRDDIGTKDAKKSKEFVINVLQENFSRCTRGGEEDKQKSWALKAILEVDFKVKADPDFLPREQETSEEDIRDIPEIEQRQVDQEMAEQSVDEPEESGATVAESAGAPAAEADPGPGDADAPATSRAATPDSGSRPWSDGSPVHGDKDIPTGSEFFTYSDEAGRYAGPTKEAPAATPAPKNEAPQPQQHSQDQEQPTVRPTLLSGPSTPGYQPIQHTNPTARIETPAFDTGANEFTQWDNTVPTQPASGPESNKENVSTAP